MTWTSCIWAGVHTSMCTETYAHGHRHAVTQRHRCAWARAHTGTCTQRCTHRRAHTHRPVHTSRSNSRPDSCDPYPQLFLSSDLSPLILEAKLALSTQPKRKHFKTLIFHFKVALIHFARTFIWANAFAKEDSRGRPFSFPQLLFP